MKVALLDDFHPLIQQSFSDWKWEVINAKKWSLDDLKKNAPHLKTGRSRQTLCVRPHPAAGTTRFQSGWYVV